MNDSKFDNALRQRHAEAIVHLSARTQAQLRNRLMVAVEPRPPVRRVAWSAATVAAALFALAIGLQLRPHPTPTSSQSVAVATATTNDPSAYGNTPYDALDENPDLYLWLASNEAIAFASE